MNPFTLRRTWPDEPNRKDDYVFRYRGKDVGRCYLHMTPLGERWRWTVFGSSFNGDAVSLPAARDEFNAAFTLHRGL